jgi:HEAT repeat protein
MNHRLLFGMMALLPAFLGCQSLQTAPSNPAETAPAPASITPQLKEAAVEIIRKGLQDQNGYIRNACIEVVVTTHQEEMMTLVTGLLRDPLVPVRFSAALAVGDMPYRPGRAAVETLLADPNPNIQLAAAYSLVKLGNPQHQEIVLRGAQSPDPTVRSNAAMLIGKLGNPANRGVLHQLLQDLESSDKARLAAVESLAMLKDPTAYKNRLWPLLISKHPDDRIIGIRGMAELGTGESRDAILTMLSDDMVEVRLCAAEELARIGEKSGQDEVLRYLSRAPAAGTEVDIADTFATLAIGRIGSADLVSYLPRRLQSPYPLQQIYAAQAVLMVSASKPVVGPGGARR